MTNQEWLLDFVRFYRPLGFFVKYASISDAEFAELLERWHAAAWERELDPSDRHADLRLLYSDEERVWWNRLEANVGMGKNAYAAVLDAWSRISRGAFTPDEIQEVWDDASGPMALSFLYQDEKTRVYPQYRGPEIDLSILPPINRLFENTGIQFCLYAQFDETAFIVALKEDEKIKLVTDRGWQFDL